MELYRSRLRCIIPQVIFIIILWLGMIYRMINIGKFDYVLFSMIFLGTGLCVYSIIEKLKTLYIMEDVIVVSGLMTKEIKYVNITKIEEIRDQLFITTSDDVVSLYMYMYDSGNELKGVIQNKIDIHKKTNLDSTL